MKFSFAALLSVSSAALSRSQLLYNELDALSGTASELIAPEKNPIFNRISHTKNELATLKSLVLTSDVQKYNSAMNLL